MRRTAAFLLLSCLVALLLPEPAAADKITRKTRLRDFPTGWCPLTTADVLEFKATGPSATIRLVADRQPGQRLDGIYVVEKSFFQQNLVNDETCDDAGPDWGSFFNPLVTGALFLEMFDADANGWKLTKSSWDPGTGTLALQPNGLGGVIVSGLQKGRTYVVGARWWTEDSGAGAALTLKVDTKGTLGCGPEGLVAGDLLLEEEE